MPMEIKICGLKRVEDALMVNKFEKIKYVGFVFANTSRKITIEKALEIKKNLRPDIKTVGVFAGQPMEEIIEIMEKADLDVCQLLSMGVGVLFRPCSDIKYKFFLYGNPYLLRIKKVQKLLKAIQMLTVLY